LGFGRLWFFLGFALTVDFAIDVIVVAVAVGAVAVLIGAKAGVDRDDVVVVVHDFFLLVKVERIHLADKKSFLATRWARRDLSRVPNGGVNSGG